ncbi:MAG: thymidine phosphorylase [Candidatus Pacearchaeota archaeon]|nr:thymidine phosphorylase [Candidatus Pacearchaeota archaeon]
MKLKAKPLKLFAGRSIAILHKETAEKLQLHEDSRIRIKKIGEKRWVTAVIDIAEEMVKKDEIALSNDITKIIKIKRKDWVEVAVELRPYSINYINKKMQGKRLNFTEIYSIISDIAKDRLKEGEIAYFISALYFRGCDMKEIYDLTRAMINTGAVLKHKEKYVLDLHSCGGVAGNRTSPIVVSLVASAIQHLGIDAIMPKTSSRAITSAAGTADVMECVAKIVFSTAELRKILDKTKACLVWNSALNLSPADDKILKVESLLPIDTEPKLLASVISKKVADGATHLLVEIPYGNSSKFKLAEAIRLKKKFLKLTSKFGIKTKTILTDGSQPVGRGVGPVLEMLDVISVLKNKKEKLSDLENRSLLFASELLALTKEISKKDALDLCKFLLYSGRAYKKFREIVLAQGGKTNFEEKLRTGKFRKEIKAKKEGTIKAIDNKKVSLIARIAGCPGDKGAGIWLHKKRGDSVQANDVLFTIFSESKEKLDYAYRIAQQSNPFEIE